ncbi:hypothetical protein ACFV4T_31655 [Streptomyces sp. NPDC059755]|uniref:hypothetical protein n=1 Tax=Streptomyces sp. NPDC059755 TaxID=3346934 RepID=UPI003667DCCF
MTQSSITSKNSGFAIEATSSGIGRITVGGFSETFVMGQTYWDLKHYEASWSNALRALEESRVRTSCLISSITNPKTANFISCWPLYRIDDAVYVQNSLILLAELDHSFDPDVPWLSVGPREVIDEDGNKISEWRTDILELRDFRERVGWR